MIQVGEDIGALRDAHVLRVTEELDLATAPDLRARVERALRTSPRVLVIDLSACPFAGVDALEVLVVLTARARRQQTSLVLYGARPIVRRALALVELEDRVQHAPETWSVRPPR